MDTKTDLYHRVLWMRERIRQEKKSKQIALAALKGLVKSAGTPPGSPERAQAIKNARSVITKLSQQQPIRSSYVSNNRK